MNGLIDKIPSAQREFFLGAVAALLAAVLPWVESNYTTWNVPAPVTFTVGALLPYAAMWVTTLTKQYGYKGKELTAGSTTPGSTNAGPTA